MTLQDLRARLTAVDRELVALIADRQRIVAEIGTHKIENAVPTRDYEREKRVLKGAREEALRLGVEPELATEIFELLIRSSLAHQERTRVAADSAGAGRPVLVIGGSGQMGGWFAEFLSSQGYDVELADPRPSDLPFARHADWRESGLEHALIVVAAPIKITAEILGGLADRRPPGTIMDVGSLKTPLRKGIASLAEAGCRVASIHPMFGPGTRLLSGKHVIFCDTGVTDATAEAKALFDSTMAEQIEMSLEDHDRLIAYVLGLSHALNLAFFTALSESGELVPRLKKMSSTTFDAQLDVASLVATDNPHLYFEIQTLNEYGESALRALEEATARVIRLVKSGDESGFVDLMVAGREYLAERA